MCQGPPIFLTPLFIVSKDFFQYCQELVGKLTCPYTYTVRAVPENAHHHPSIVSRSPFWLEGSPNVFLETIKRGEDDDFESESASKTVILRLYEAFGGHGRVQLRISPYVRVVEAYLTNLLEDHKTILSFVPDVDVGTDDAATASRFRLDLDFRGFEVKTVKLVIADRKRGAESDDGVRCDVRMCVG
jgi:alpha-mannosidase